MPRFGDPEPLGPGHELAAFDCGVASLDQWLQKHASQGRSAGSARTFVVNDAHQDRVVGCYALNAASIAHEQATARARKGMPRHAIPAALLARLAVDTSVQGRGIGAWLLRDAMLRALAASEAVGIRVLLVHAMDDGARQLYERHGLASSPTDPLNLQMLMKDIRQAVEEA